jgi:DNA invertase Pin-like site-specific DNA recombinase
MMMTMLTAVAEMERDLLVERTQAGLARAKSEGKTLGRPSKTTADQRADIVAKYTAGESVSGLARIYAREHLEHRQTDLSQVFCYFYGLYRKILLAIANP